MKTSIPRPPRGAKRRRRSARAPLPAPRPITTPLMAAFTAHRSLEAIVDEVDVWQPEAGRRAVLEEQLFAAHHALSQPAALRLSDYAGARRLLEDLLWLFSNWRPAAEVVDLKEYRARKVAR